MTDVEPPLGKASESEVERAVQELRMAKASPSMETREKLRCSSPLWPRACSCSSSSVGCVEPIVKWRMQVVNRLRRHRTKDPR